MSQPSMPSLPPPSPPPDGCVTTLMIIGGIALLLPGVCVGMLNPGGALLVLGAAGTIAIGLGRLTQTLTHPEIQAASRPGRAVTAFVILMLWGLWLAALVFALYLVAAFNGVGHIRWQ